MKYIDLLLDRITMYRLLLYYLLGLLLAASVLSVVGPLHYGVQNIVLGAAFISTICYVTNEIFAAVWEAPVNHESSILTALILALIITPPVATSDYLFLAAAGGLAISSKYLITINRAHVFNPAALAVAITSVTAGQAASWWVGTKVLLPFVVIGGLLLARKIRRLRMVFVFLLVAIIASCIYSVLGHHGVSGSLNKLLFNSGLFFLAFVMLTEPLTSPTTNAKQVWYAALAGLIFPPQVHLARVYATPELTLLASNVFAFIISPRQKVLTKPVQKIQLAPNIYDYVFTPSKKFRYEPGQYMEWTLPHKGADARGERRYLTLASSPTEDTLRFGVKFYPNGSSYKKALQTLQPTTPIAAGQLSGDFTLPKNPQQKIAFLAGGIGVTPFRSMAKYLTDTNQARSVVMMYAASVPEELVYSDVLEAARAKIGMQTTYLVAANDASFSNPHGRTGKIDAAQISQTIPDYKERLFYISGPHEMVLATRQSLREMGVAHHNIKEDFFPGYA